MPEYHVAQLNVAKMTVELDDPIMKDFVDNLDKVNSLLQEHGESAVVFSFRQSFPAAEQHLVLPAA